MDGLGLLERIAGELYTGVEHVAGGEGERREAERVMGIVESTLAVKAELVPLPVYSWRLRAVEVYPGTRFASVAPYVESFDVEAPVERVEGDPTSHRSWRLFPEGRIAVAPFPRDPDDLKRVALHAWESGAAGVLVYTSVPRRIVTTGTWGYSYNAGAKTPIPVVVVDEESVPRILGEGRARILVVAETRESTGYIVRARSSGGGLVAVGAHYDRWYGGFQDDLLGVAQAIAAAGILSEKNVGVELLLFTAEEHGAPGYAGWYWAWGSRWYAGQLADSGVAGDYSIYINFDVAGGEPVIVSGSPQYTVQVVESLRAVGVEAGERRFECPECDSMSFARIGVPTISVHGLWSDRVRGFYHTSRDEPGVADYRAAWAAVEAAARAAVKGPRWGDFAGALMEVLGEGPMLARNIYYTLVGEASRRGWDQVYRWVASRYLKPVFAGDYRIDGGGSIEACLFPEACTLKLVNEGRPHTIMIPGEERVLYHPAGGGFEQQVFHVILELWRRFRVEWGCVRR